MTLTSRRVACFGEIVMRVSVPAGELPLQSPRFDAWVGGAEANVAVALAAMGHGSRMISAVPTGPIGDGVLAELRRHGVDTARVARGDGRMGLYYHIPGGPMRAAEVVYDRAASVFAETEAHSWDWPALLDGAEWLHVSGVTPALGPRSAEAALAAVRAARAAGMGVSFDGNWRGRLWERWQAEPAAILCAIVEQATVLFGNHRDASLLLGQEFSGEGEDRRRAAALALLERFPALDLVASTARHIVGAAEHHIAARVDSRDAHSTTGDAVIAAIVDRVGTGDAFAAGVLDALWQGSSLATIANQGLLLSALKHGLRGDLAPFSRASVEQASMQTGDVAR
ncbi:sugar kinase [Sphingopyxis sp. DHUNG17]|uniref:sugar kinase n=1 Tax=Sphingopyxis jiangsuensis TaxID=2871171 RepID=UPI00191ECACD|nr:sugar kinase [Sphingopyxis lutea]MBL0768614.1 sugar kinase [Sphingopyxis lutea]